MRASDRKADYKLVLVECSSSVRFVVFTPRDLAVLYSCSRSCKVVQLGKDYKRRRGMSNQGKYGKLLKSSVRYKLDGSLKKIELNLDPFGHRRKLLLKKAVNCGEQGHNATTRKRICHCINWRPNRGVA